MHRLYFLFARGLTPPLFRIECQLEGLTRLHYVVCVVVTRKKKKERKNVFQSRERRAIVGMHYSRVRSREERRFLRRSSVEGSEPDRADSRLTREREGENLFSHNLNPR